MSSTTRLTSPANEDSIIASTSISTLGLQEREKGGGEDREKEEKEKERKFKIHVQCIPLFS